MKSVIITAYREERTIGKAIEQILPQLEKKDELIVTAPDRETIEVVQRYKDKRIRFIQDEGKGKPLALNKVLNIVKGKILIFTDGDVFIEEDAIERICKPFENKKIGAATGRPISMNGKQSMLGYWSNLLTDAGAHKFRLSKRKKGKFIMVSGYLFAMRKGLVEEIPENTLSDDAAISHIIYNKRYEIVYVPSAKVYVKYPDNFNDWIKQKLRSAGGYSQLKKGVKAKESSRNFLKEGIHIHWALSYPRTIKEYVWTLILVLARIYLWWIIIWNIKLKKKEFNKIWLRVESTK